MGTMAGEPDPTPAPAPAVYTRDAMEKTLPGCLVAWTRNFGKY